MPLICFGPLRSQSEGIGGVADVADGGGVGIDGGGGGGGGGGGCVACGVEGIGGAAGVADGGGVGIDGGGGDGVGDVAHHSFKEYISSCHREFISLKISPVAPLLSGWLLYAHRL